MSNVMTHFVSFLCFCPSRCECNGHSDSCDPVTGTDCDCKNHTTTPKCPSNNLEEPCYQYEVSCVFYEAVKTTFRCPCLFCDRILHKCHLPDTASLLRANAHQESASVVGGKFKHLSDTTPVTVSFIVHTYQTPHLLLNLAWFAPTKHRIWHKCHRVLRNSMSASSRKNDYRSTDSIVNLIWLHVLGITFVIEMPWLTCDTWLTL